MTNIAYLGLGIMGRASANLIRGGHAVTVWNRTSERCQPLVERALARRATPAETVAALTSSCTA